jgi:hypothetical protein
MGADGGCESNAGIMYGVFGNGASTEEAIKET